MKYLYFNQQDSVEHFDLAVDSKSYMLGGETFFHAYNGELFTLNHYSSVEQDYTLKYSGITLLQEERKYEYCEAMVDGDYDALAHTHQIDVDWKIIAPEGFICLSIKGFDAKIEWSNGQIKDLNGEVASVFKKGDFYNVRETLTQEQSDRQVEISRLEKLRKMVKDDVVRNQLTWKIVELKQIR